MNGTPRLIGIVGAGAWGLALARAVERAGAASLVWSRRALSGAELIATARITGDANALRGVEALLLAVPAQEMREVVERLAPSLSPLVPLVICAKGIARPDNLLLNEVLANAAPGHPVAVLSGPNFAAEVARGMPTAVTIASHDLKLATHLAALLGSAVFRPYVSDDPVGVQLGGAIKNVIAIACGIVAGRGLGENARAALMTRGLAEMARLGQAMGGHPKTFAGLAGLGDMTLSATSQTSRNFRLGLALGRGETLENARAQIGSVVEGVSTAEAVAELATRHDVEMPISSAVAMIVGHNAEIGATIYELLARPFKSETA